MTFEQFQKTRTFVQNLAGHHLVIDSVLDPGSGGFLYEDETWFIEILPDGAFWTFMNNEEFLSRNLEDAERFLYSYAVAFT